MRLDGIGRRGAQLAAALACCVATAASATTWHVPGSGSNVCTIGDPNCNTIQQAVTAATGGDTILLGAGSFSGTGNNGILLTKSLTITGAGRASTTVALSSGQFGFSIRANDITIGDLAIQGGATGVNFQSVSSNHTTFARIDFSGNTSRGIDVSTGAAVTVTDVAIDDCTFATPNIGLRMASNSQVNGLAITNSSFTGNLYGIYQANDGNTSKLIDFTVDACTFANNTNWAIYTEEMRDVTIEDSVFTHNGVGILLLKIYSGSGVAASNITIQRNQFTQTVSSAIDLEIRASGLETGLTIADNTIDLDVSAITTNRSAMFLWLASAATHAPVNISNNTVTLGGTFGAATAAYGLRLRGNGPVTLTGNLFDGGGVGGSGTTPATSGVYVEANSSGGAMPATATIGASCNRITGFRNGVSVFDSVGAAYGGLVAGASVTFGGNDIAGNADAGVVNGVAAETVAAQGTWWGCAAGPGNPGCDGVSGAVDASLPAAAPAPCAPCSSAAQCDDDNACTVDACATTCSNTPGNAGATCRVAAGACDLAETCDGVSSACPTDALAPASSACRPAAGVCDVAETCDGLSAACPADAKSTAACRAAAGVCDVAESCDGVGDDCPADALVPANSECRAAAGVCDVAETCDGLSAACPADAKSTAVCRAGSGACDVAESCDGVADACPADAVQPDGTSCSDGAFCNGAETCQGGTCAGGTAPCVQLCNEVTDACESGCLPAPQSCRGAAKSVLLVKDRSDDDSKDKLVWKWIKGAETSQAEFGDPTAAADYSLCLYAGTAASLIGEALLPAGASWSLLGGTGYKYGQATALPDGIVKATLKGGAANKSKAIVKGKGIALPDLVLPLAEPLTVQLVNNDSGLCVGATYSGAQLLKNESGKLKAKAP